MRVVNKKLEIITEYDLSKGRLITTSVLKEDAIVPDNITKFAYTDEDYEQVQMYIPHPEKTTAQKIADLKKQLQSTDYKIIKCSECQLVGLPMPYDIIALHAERQDIRDEINLLEQQEILV